VLTLLLAISAAWEDARQAEIVVLSATALLIAILEFVLEIVRLVDAEEPAANLLAGTTMTAKLNLVPARLADLESVLLMENAMPTALLSKIVMLALA
jgi:hypothetical protein